MKMIKMYLVRSKSTLLNHIIALNVLCVRKTLIQPLQKMFDFASEKKKHWQIQPTLAFWKYFFHIPKPTKLKPKKECNLTF